MKGIRKTGQIVAVAAMAGLVLTACGTTGGGSTTAKGGCGNYQLAFLGAETGDSGALGQNMVGGIKLALDEYNKKHSDCKVTLKDYDSQGDPSKASPLASQIVGNSKIVGLVGPGFSGESNATGKTFSQAGLPSISASATNVTLTQQGWKTWHRVIGNDAAQGAADAKYLLNTVKAKKTIVIDDAEDYGKGLAGYVKSGLGKAVTGTDTVQVGQTDFSATVSKIKSAGADSVFYGGYYAEAGLLDKQLRQGGWKGTFMSGDGSFDPAFVKAAGASAATGAVLSAPAGPAPADFGKKYKALIGADAGLYSTQAYDAANIFLAGIDAGKTKPADMNAFINSYTGTGVAGPIKFDDKGDIASTAIYAYSVKNGVLDTANPTAIK